MGSKANIKNGVKAAILYVRTMHEDWSPNRIRSYLLGNLGRFNLVKSDIPVVRSIYNVIERNQPQIEGMQKIVDSESFQELESPWSMGTLERYPVPVETITDILAVKEWGESHPDMFGKPRNPLTVRQALWISRLFAVACLYRNPLNKKRAKQLKGFDLQEWLWQWAEAYAQYEIICKLSKPNEIPDMAKLDKAMWHGAWPVSAKNAVIWFNRDGTIDDVGEIPSIENPIMTEEDLKKLNQ